MKARIPMNLNRIAIGLTVLVWTLVASSVSTEGSPSLRSPVLSPPAIDLRLQAQIEDYLSGQTGTYGVAIRNLATGQSVMVNASGHFIAASTYKCW